MENGAYPQVLPMGYVRECPLSMQSVLPTVRGSASAAPVSSTDIFRYFLIRYGGIQHPPAQAHSVGFWILLLPLGILVFVIL